MVAENVTLALFFHNKLSYTTRKYFSEADTVSWHQFTVPGYSPSRLKFVPALLDGSDINYNGLKSIAEWPRVLRVS
jgi:hypothetical protein